jgi:hypothetical protein
MRLLFLAALLPTAALAQTWNESFTQTQLDALLAGAGLKVLVTGAGEPADEVARAAEALRTRLRASGLTSLVMDAAALGVVREDSDDSLRKKATTLPWDRLLIVRVFPGVRAAAPTAVITVSERSGPTSRSLVVTRGVLVVPAPPPKEPEPVVPPPILPPQPVPPPTAPIAPPPEPPPIAPQPPAPPPPPARDPRELHFGQAISRNRVELVDKGVFLGARRISGLELYQQLGRADFIGRYDDRVRLKRTFGIAGGAGMAVGLAGLIVSVTSRCIRRQGTATGKCLQTELPDLTIPSIGVAAIGFGFVITALVLSSEPVPAEDVLPAIDTYNAGLEKKPAVSLRLEPSLGVEGAGLTLAGSF